MKHIGLLLLILSVCLPFMAQQRQPVYTRYSSPAQIQGASPTYREQVLLNNLEKNDNSTYSWCRDIFRLVDSYSSKNNSPFFSSINTTNGSMHLYTFIFNLIKNNQIKMYMVVDGPNGKTKQYVDAKEVFNLYNIPYIVNTDNTLSVLDANIPQYVLSYCIKERWYFDTRSNKGGTKIESICPVFSKYQNVQGIPLYWISFADLAPYLERAQATTAVFRNSVGAKDIDVSFYDYIRLRHYNGKIYQVGENNLFQTYPNPAALAAEQYRLENELKDIERNFLRFK